MSPQVFKDEEDVIDALARITAAVDDDASAKTLWQSIFAAGPTWADHFVSDWLMIPLGEFEPVRYLRRWREIIHGSSTLKKDHGDLQADALGIGQVGARHWEESASNLMLGISDLFSQWLDGIEHASDIASAARLLVVDASKDLCPVMLRPIRNATKRLVRGRRFRGDDGNNIAFYAKVLYETQTKDASSQWMADLRELIDLLASHHIQSAVDLQRRR